MTTTFTQNFDENQLIESFFYFFDIIYAFNIARRREACLCFEYQDIGISSQCHSFYLFEISLDLHTFNFLCYFWIFFSISSRLFFLFNFSTIFPYIFLFSRELILFTGTIHFIESRIIIKQQ